MFCNRGAWVQLRVNLLHVDASTSDQLSRLCRLFHLGKNQLGVQSLSLLSLFSETGPGCVCCSTLCARWTQPALKVTLIRPGWLADGVFRRAVVICTSQKTSVFYKALIKLVCVARRPGVVWSAHWRRGSALSPTEGWLYIRFMYLLMYLLWIAMIQNIINEEHL